MLRATTPDDTATLLEITRQTGVFKPLEVDALEEVLDDYHAGMKEHQHRAFTMVLGEAVAGFVYYAPAVMTDNSWYLYWIVVRKDLHGQGVGSKLLAHVEEDVRQHEGRVLFIETSSTPHYEPTRNFYLKHDYEITGQLRDFYADGDDMVVFRKRLAPPMTR
jgi:ribosomal protein S18 acetylase RimI-like enzyme